MPRGLYARGVDHDFGLGDRNIDSRRGCIGGPNAYAANIFDNTPDNMDSSCCDLVQGNVNAVGCEPKDIAILNVQVLACKEADAVDSGADSVDAQVAENDYIAGAGLNNDAVGAADQD